MMKTRRYKTVDKQLFRDVMVNDWPEWLLDVTKHATFQGIHAQYFNAGLSGGAALSMKRKMCQRGSFNELALNAGCDVGEAIAALEPDAVAQLVRHLKLVAAGETGKKATNRGELRDAAARMKSFRNQ